MWFRKGAFSCTILVAWAGVGAACLVPLVSSGCAAAVAGFLRVPKRAGLPAGASSPAQAWRPKARAGRPRTARHA